MIIDYNTQITKPIANDSKSTMNICTEYLNQWDLSIMVSKWPTVCVLHTHWIDNHTVAAWVNPCYSLHRGCVWIDTASMITAVVQWTKTAWARPHVEQIFCICEDKFTFQSNSIATFVIIIRVKFNQQRIAKTWICDAGWIVIVFKSRHQSTFENLSLSSNKILFKNFFFQRVFPFSRVLQGRRIYLPEWHLLWATQEGCQHIWEMEGTPRQEDNRNWNHKFIMSMIIGIIILS